MIVCPSCATEASSELTFCPRCGTTLNDPLIGVVLGERYRVVSRIGIGGMGAVYRAEHTTLKRDLAVKVLLPEIGGKDEFVRRFQREAESASRLAHPNIITVIDFGRSPEGLLFLVMEFLDGVSLTSIVRQGPVPVPRAVAIVSQMLDGLEHAHNAGVVHRDLKPDNIMLVEREGRADVVKILDFGIAKVTDPEGTREALTQAGVIFGTPEYLSPEQALGETVDARADLYATGVILFEMLTGRRPFESEDKVKIISMHLSHPVPAISSVTPGITVPAALSELVSQALEKQRDNRFLSAAAFRAALGDAVLDAGPGNQEGVVPGPRFSMPESAIAPTQQANRVTHAKSAPASGGPGVLTVAPRKRRWTIGLALSATLLAGVGIALSRRPQTGTTLVATTRVPAVAPTAPALAAQIRAVEAHLAAADVIRARAALEELLSAHPKDARVRYLLGRVAFAEDRRTQALDNYREAIALDPGFRADAVLIEHLGVAVSDAKTADAALDLAIERVGRPATDILERVANGSGDVRRRQRAAVALDELGEGKRVDQISLKIAQVRKATTCEERKPLVEALGDTGDLRALPALRGLRPRSGLSGIFGQAPDSSCMKSELEDAILKLEEKLPPEKKPASRPSSHKAGSRSSLMRGR